VEPGSGGAAWPPAHRLNRHVGGRVVPLTARRTPLGWTVQGVSSNRRTAAWEGGVSDQVLLRDFVTIPDEVHAGDFVLALAKGVGEKSTITSYVVTDALAANFDRALGLVRSAVETGASRAAYLDGSFGCKYSEFLWWVAGLRGARHAGAWCVICGC
jgi:hypothetical protein